MKVIFASSAFSSLLKDCGPTGEEHIDDATTRCQLRERSNPSRSIVVQYRIVDGFLNIHFQPPWEFLLDPTVADFLSNTCPFFQYWRVEH